MNIKLAGCIILDENQKIYLLHRNKKGVTQWELPGGKVEDGETGREAAMRELQEELGVEVDIIHRLGGSSFLENDIAFTYEWFFARVKSGSLTICEPETFDDLKAFTIDEMKDLQLSGNMKNLLNQIVEKKVEISNT